MYNSQHFSDFFHSKVTCIRRNLDSTTVTPPSVPDQPFCGTVWGAFQSVSEDEVKKILNQSTIKTCELDPLPASFLTHCLDDLLPHLTSIINDSLHSGLFPSAFKSVIVKPHLKKTALNPEICKNYKSVSNLSFLSKILEKVVLRQHLNHLLTNNLFYSHQSAYRAGHSTETALPKIINDLLSALDDDKVTLLSLLDLSAAFDTTDHSTLVSRLSHSFGISDTVLTWFNSYLSDHIPNRLCKLLQISPGSTSLRRSPGILLVITWCFEPSQPQRITSGLKTNFSLSPSYSLNKL